jgi:hypothetical protein
MRQLSYLFQDDGVVGINETEKHLRPTITGFKISLPKQIFDAYFAPHTHNFVGIRAFCGVLRNHVVCQKSMWLDMSVGQN